MPISYIFFSQIILPYNFPFMKCLFAKFWDQGYAGLVVGDSEWSSESPLVTYIVIIKYRCLSTTEITLL